jgi:serine protease Do
MVGLVSIEEKSNLLAVVAAVLALSSTLGLRGSVAAETAAESMQANCGWIGARVRPVSAVMAESLGMDAPYGGIFESPEPHSPAAYAGIEDGDLITAINDKPLMNARDFAPTVLAMAPGTIVYLNLGQLRVVKLILGSTKCPTSP